MRRFRARARAWIPACAGMTNLKAGMTEINAGMTEINAGMTEINAGITGGKAGATRSFCHSKHELFAASTRVWNPCSKESFVSELYGFEGKGMDPNLRWDDE